MNRFITTIEAVGVYGGLGGGTIAELAGQEVLGAELMTGGLALFVLGAIAEGIYNRRQHHEQADR